MYKVLDSLYWGLIGISDVECEDTEFSNGNNFRDPAV